MSNSQKVFERPKKKIEPPAIDSGDVTLKSPPSLPRPVPPNVAQRVSPWLMVLAMVGMMVMMYKSGAGIMRNPMFMVFPIMLMMGMVGMGGNRGVGSKLNEAVQERGYYFRYIDGLRERAISSARKQHDLAEHHHPNPIWLLDRLGGPQMWERKPSDPKFGHVRVGLGTERADLKYLNTEVGDLAEVDPAAASYLNDYLWEYTFVKDIPRPMSLTEQPSWGFDGDRDKARAALRSMVTDLSYFQSADDIGIAVITDDDHAHEWDFLKFLPHHRFSQTIGRGQNRALRGRSMTFESGTELVDVLGEDWNGRGRYQRGTRSSIAQADGTTAAETRSRRHLFVICDSPDVNWSVLGGGHATGVRGVTFLDVTGSSPYTAADAVLRYSDEFVYRKENILEDTEPGFLATPDLMSLEDAQTFARAMSPWRVGTRASSLVESVGMGKAASEVLKFLGIHDAATFDPAAVRRWSKDRRNFLRVPVGEFIDSGQPWYIDLKDGENGPHLGVGGSTGGGKSEFLRVLVVLLCATHSPDDLMVTPADFKGGATFQGLDRLPHVPMVLDNLETNMDRVQRLLQAFQGELDRRQKLINLAAQYAIGMNIGLSGIKNIGEYRAFRRKYPQFDLPPMPYWLVPFDELMQAKREFGVLLTIGKIMGTVGRSLGVSFIPVSQTLDESLMVGIDTHMRGRLAFKMNKKADYRPILGSFSAPALPDEKGVGYWKSDLDVAPQRVKSAYISGQYVAPQPEKTDEESKLDRNYFKPRLISARPDERALEIESQYSADERLEDDEDLEDEDEQGADDLDLDEDIIGPDDELEAGAEALGPTNMSVIIDRILTLPDELYHNPLKPEINVYTPVSEFADQYLAEHGSAPLDVVAPFGIIDKPRTAEKDVLATSLTQHVAIAGGPKTGKSTALLSMILGTASLYSPDHVHFYGITSGGVLAQANGLNHVGDIVQITDRYNVQRVISHIHMIYKNRARTWSRAGLQDPSDWRRRRFAPTEGQTPVPEDGHGDVVLMIDGFEGFLADFAEYEQIMLQLARYGADFGIHLVVSVPHLKAGRFYKFVDYFEHLIELKLSDAIDSEMGRKSAASVPQMPGRGLVSAVGTGKARKEMEIAASADSIPHPVAWHILIGEPAIALPETDDHTAQVLTGAAAIKHLNDKHPGHAAARIPSLPERVPISDLATIPAHITEPIVRLGLRETDMATQCWYPRRDGNLYVLGERGSGRRTTLRTVCRELNALYKRSPDDAKPLIYIFDLDSELADAVDEDTIARYIHKKSQIEAAVSEIVAHMAGRDVDDDEDLSPKEIAARKRQGHSFEGPEIYMVIESISNYVDAASDPFMQLGNFIERGARVGLHVVASRNADNMAYTGTRGIMGGIKNSNCPVLLLSSDPSIVQIVGKVRGEPLDPGRGKLIDRGEMNMIQVAIHPDDEYRKHDDERQPDLLGGGI
ncbi:FtsK/SpoIIIE domain-containing protein [Mycobacteroides abscessus]|uniref:FtsK/SpoIIIE domain-containing protein n=1 Tax=Mycobacteroides abscessus TaxID=36809 RepID=UPI00092C11A1|nr:FtsK/SpoIIIE domain-containing protein [Mycobacteroides abscessus]SIC20772.1 DNA segregation ATPase FtsK/SpoIIIE [Mycobacteroides abscessus subsp. abscessus]